MNILNAFEWLIGGQGPSAGAIDVIAIKQRDGSIKCSPFHVKLSKRKKDAKVVKLRINGRDVNLQMKVGRAGEAFFVEAIEDEGLTAPGSASGRPSSPALASSGDTPPSPPKHISQPTQSSPIASKTISESKSPAPDPEPHRSRRVRDAVEFGTGFTVTGPPAGARDTTDEDTNKEDDDKSMGHKQDTEAYSSSENPLSSKSQGLESGGGGSSRAPAVKRSTGGGGGGTQWTWAWGDLPTKAKKPEEHAPLPDSSLLKDNIETDSHDVAVSERAISDVATASASVPPSTRPSSLPGANSEDVVDPTEHRKEQRFSHASKDRGSLDNSSDHQKLGTGFPSRMLSLCGSKLSELIETGATRQEEIPIAEIHHILMENIVSRQEFINKTSEVLNNPNLVVLINDTVIPWSVAKMMLEASDPTASPVGYTTSSSLDNDASTDMEVLRIAHRLALETNMSDLQDNGTHALPAWTGRRISHFLLGDSNILSADAHGRLTKPPSESNMNESDDGIASNRHSCSTIEFGTGLPIDGNDDASSGPAYGAVEFDIDASDHSSSSANQSTRPSLFPRFASHNQVLSKHINVQWEASESPDWNRNASTASLFQFLQEHGINDHHADGISSYIYNLPGQSGLFGNSSDAPSLWTWGDDDEESPALSDPQKEVKTPTVEPTANALPTSQEVSVTKVAVSPLGSPNPNPSEEQPSTMRPESPRVDDTISKPIDLKQLSLLDISLDEIYPGPARGDMYSDSDSESHRSMSFDEGDRGSLDEFLTCLPDGRMVAKRYLYRRSLVPTQEQLADMQLEEGANEIIFEVEGCAPITSQLHLWPEDARIVAIDAEGVVQSVTNSKRSTKTTNANTATRNIESSLETKTLSKSSGASTSSSSSAGGVVGWSSLLLSFGGSSSSSSSSSSNGGSLAVAQNEDPGLHARQLFHDIHKNGYKILYLANKPVSHSSATKTELVRMGGEQSSVKLPPGPVFLSPDTLIQSIDPSRPDLFKAAALRGTRALFPPQHNPFYAGFCSSEDDMYAFERCGFPEGRIFLLDTSGLVQSMNRTTKRSFKEILELRHLMFPLYQDMFARTCSLGLPSKTPPMPPTLTNTTSSPSSEIAVASTGPPASSPLPPTARPATSPGKAAGAASPSPSPPAPSSAVAAVSPGPPASRGLAVTTSEDAYGDFNYWRRPIPTL